MAGSPAELSALRREAIDLGEKHVWKYYPIVGPAVQDLIALVEKKRASMARQDPKPA